MRHIFATILLAVAAGPVLAETRCGWITNPTPGNVYLTDAHGDWWLSIQGQGPVPGFEPLWGAAMSDEWVQMQPAGYGYGCACIVGAFSAPGPDSVTYRVSDAWSLPLMRCVEDPAIPYRDLQPLPED